MMDFETMYCGAIKRGDIFLCKFNDKKNSVVVLQDSVLNERLETVIVVPIDHYNGGKIYKNEVLLDNLETGFGKSGLCSLYKICQVSRTNFLAKKGEIKKQRLSLFYEALDISLGRFRDV